MSPDRPVKLGLVLPTHEDVATGEPHRWSHIRQAALTAEAIGLDTVWIADELLWRLEGLEEPRGWWECVATCAAVAASTSRIAVGTWILSALHRNPGLTARVAETLDEVSGGRFILGLGSGYPSDQATSFGFPVDHVYGRFEESFSILIAMLREPGTANLDGRFHRAVELVSRPRGPRPGRLPIMLGARGPKMMRLAAAHADIWSWHAMGQRSEPNVFIPKLAELERACAEVGRDPATIGRSVGIFVDPLPDVEVDTSMGGGVTGSHAEIADQLGAFAAIGVTQVEMMLRPTTLEAVEAMAPVVEALDLS